jgi:hypothetical protein
MPSKLSTGPSRMPPPVVPTAEAGVAVGDPNSRSGAETSFDCDENTIGPATTACGSAGDAVAANNNGTTNTRPAVVDPSNASRALIGTPRSARGWSGWESPTTSDVTTSAGDDADHAALKAAGVDVDEEISRYGDPVPPIVVQPTT